MGGRVRIQRFSWVILCILVTAMIVSGVYLIVQGMQEQPPQAAALPNATYEVPSSELTKVVAAARESATASSAPKFDSPDTLYIPSLGVSASIIPESVSEGSLDIPRDPKVVGLARAYAPLAAQTGTTLIAGHVTYNGISGALAQLADIEQGALVVATDSSGKATIWAVTGIAVRDKADFPTLQLDGPHSLVIVTCGGPASHVNGAWEFRDNVIVTAVPA